MSKLPEEKPEHGKLATRTNVRAAKRWGPLILLLVLMVLGYHRGWFEYLSLASLIRERDDLIGLVDANLTGSLAVFFLIYAVSVALSFPGASLLTIAGGFLFGWALGGAVTVLAATAGAVIVFVIARSSAGEFLTERAGPFLSRISSGFRENAFHYLLFLRLTPVFPFWLVNIAPAMFKMPLGSFALGTFLGIIPGTFAFAFIGSGLDSIITAQEAADPGCTAKGTCTIDVGALVTPQLLAAFFALGIVSLIPVVLKRWRNTGS
ncbi:TVP38/TMEM64 family protein [Roseibium sp. RKSG952]|uniref:TVP38/TMEM64 family protein n=1 Tax=Roseibium sp. RKSG952 TaxID=2529384 RepID=UPI0034CEEA0B